MKRLMMSVVGLTLGFGSSVFAADRHWENDRHQPARRVETRRDWSRNDNHRDRYDHRRVEVVRRNVVVEDYRWLTSRRDVLMADIYRDECGLAEARRCGQSTYGFEVRLSNARLELSGIHGRIANWR